MDIIYCIRLVCTLCYGSSYYKHILWVPTMNIFTVHTDPVVAAQSLCDKHVVKMPLETAQMLCSVWHRYGYGDKVAYKEAYKNHPCTVWAGENQPNYSWLWLHGMELCKEYTKRYNKVHKCQQVIKDLRPINDWILPFIMNKPASEFIPHPQCMPEQYKTLDATEAYRNYYKGEKAYFAKWNKGTPAPEWWEA